MPDALPGTTLPIYDSNAYELQCVCLYIPVAKYMLGEMYTEQLPGDQIQYLLTLW